MIGDSLGRMDIPYFLLTFPSIWGGLASHVCSSMQIPYNIGNVAQVDEVMRPIVEQAKNGKIAPNCRNGTSPNGYLSTLGPLVEMVRVPMATFQP